MNAHYGLKFSLVAVGVIAACFILSACSSSAPSCADSKSIEMVTTLATQKYDERRKFLGNTIPYTVEVNNIRQVEHDEKNGSYVCQADLDVKSANLLMTFKKQIKFKMELTQPKNEAYATVWGL